MKKRLQESRWVRVVVPLVVLALYSVVLSWFISWLVPEYPANVNGDFVGRVWIWSLVAAGLYLIAYVALPIFLRYFVVFEGKKKGRQVSEAKKTSRPAFKNSIEKFDLILVLLPLTPVVQYILNNQDILSPLGSLYIIAVFLAFSVLLVIGVPALLGLTGTTKTMMLLGATFAFMITNMASLSAGAHWFERGSFPIQLIAFVGLFVVAWLLYFRVGRKFLYAVVAIFFVVNSISAWWGARQSTETALPGDNKLVQLVGTKEPSSTPNIYVLVYDSYVVNETMLQYGIDNSAQEGYLEAEGFKIYPHTYSLGAESIRSMGRTLNASTKLYGAENSAVAGDGVVQNLLKKFGYRTYGIFPTNIFFRGVGSDYDVSFPQTSSSAAASSSHDLLVKAIFMGEFRFDVGFTPGLYTDFLEYKQGILETASDAPRFLYMHDVLPGHSQISGKCLPDEMIRYKERVDQSNDNMKGDVETIIQNDPGAIIIVAGDHGPHLTRNCTTAMASRVGIAEVSRLDIQERFGTFLAIRWPSAAYSQYDAITVHQDVFPAVFAYMFDDDSLLQAKVEPTTLYSEYICGAYVTDGIIHGGVNDGEPLFVAQT